MLCLAIIILYPFFKVVFSKYKPRNVKIRSCILFLWFLSINGLSVYNTMTLDLRNTFIVLVMGKVYMDIRTVYNKNKVNGLEIKN